MPKSVIDLSAIPGLDDALGLFGSALQAGGEIDDRIVDLMVYIYEILPPSASGF